MRIGYLFAGALLCLLIVRETSAQCLCAAKGEDYCAAAGGCKGGIRPVPKLIERIATAKFPPIGDSCWCGKQLVEPAVPPKPPCKSAAPPPPPGKCNCCPAGPTGPPPPPPLPPCLAVPNMPVKKLPPGIPADPISISLALRAGKAINVPEAKLSYGAVGIPIPVEAKKIYFSNIPEEKLYALNSEVIELKKLIPKKKKVEIIEEEESEEVEDAALPPPYLSYKDLGYGPALYKNPMFLRYNSYARPAVVVEKPQHLAIRTDCGFKPGKISYSAKLIEEAPVPDDCDV